MKLHVVLCVCMVLVTPTYTDDVQDTILSLQETVARQQETLARQQQTIEEFRELLSQHTASYHQMATRVDDMADMVVSLHNQSDNPIIGTSYIIWGRNNCPAGAEQVYAGVMSASDRSQQSGVNYQCLPHAPEYANYSDGIQSDGGLIYGAQYEGHPDDVFDMSNLQGTTFVNQDVPCSMCYVQNRTTVQMIPARTTCPTGWTQEYWGYLVSSYYSSSSYSQTTYECVDNAPEAYYSGVEDVSQSPGVYLVEIDECDDVIACPSYIPGYELACTVCTR